MSWRAIGQSLVLILTGFATCSAAESRFALTNSRSDYVHWIDLYDASNRRIDVTDAAAPPYSPRTTCGRCHDYEAILQGHHFNAQRPQPEAGRRGEPWIWTDPRTGTELPLSYRKWPGTYDPRDLGISSWDFVLKFGRQLPGPGTASDQAAPVEGGPAAETTEAATEGNGSADATESAEGRWKLSGSLDIDCMLCHSDDPAYSPEVWWSQLEGQNFAWAPTAALGLAKVEGNVSRLPDDFDPAAAEPDSKNQLPKTSYYEIPVNGEGKVFFDIVHAPRNSACYYCHSVDFVDERAEPDWTYDEDVHVRAGISCADCHRNGIDHHTVRGFEGEQHPSGEDVSSLSCRGCHMDGDSAMGRLGAPKPLHKGLPALHLEKLSCTACHSGPRPAEQALQIQTSMAHGLGLPSHDYSPELAPGIVEPVMMREGEVLYPHRMIWPAFWGSMKDGTITPLDPDAVYDTLRTTLRVRRGSTLRETFGDAKLSNDEKTQALGEERAKVAETELTEEERAKLESLQSAKALASWHEKLAEGLEKLKEILPVEGAEPVYVSGGEAFRRGEEGKATSFEHEAAQPYTWQLAHDVRPARWSLGVKGCYECHADGTPIFEGQVSAIAAAPVEQSRTYVMHQLAGYDKTKMDAWNASFQGRTAFKYFGFAAVGIAGLVLLSYVFAGITALPGWVLRRSNRRSENSSDR